MFEFILVLSYFLAVSFSWVSPELRIDAPPAVPYICFPVRISTLLTGKCIRNCLYLNWLVISLLPRGANERWSWQIPVVAILSQRLHLQYFTENVFLITPAKRVENHGSPWLVSGNSSVPVHALLPQWCVLLRVVYFTVWFSTLLTGKCLRNCLYLNWLGSKSLAKRSFRKGVLEDSCRGFNLTTPSSSVSYHECFPNRACQEGRNFAPVHAIRPCVFLSVLSLCQNYLWVYPCFVVLFRCGFRKRHRSCMLMRRQRFRTFAFQWAFRPSWQVNLSVIVCILVD